MSQYCSDFWDSCTSRIAANKRLDKKKKRMLLKSVQTLRKNLGRNWPIESEDTRHKILWLVRNVIYEIEYGLLVIWGDSMSAVEGAKGFGDILDKIRSSDCFDSSIAELEIAARFAEHGCRIEFEPDAGCKRPDLLCENERSRFFIEVKTITTSREAQKVIQTQKGILDICGHMFAVGKIFKPLSPSRLENVRDILSKKVVHATSNKEGVDVYIKGILKMHLISHEQQGYIEICKKWLLDQEEIGALPRGSRGLSGPPVRTRPASKIKQKINKFANEHQIPQSEIGVLVITGQFISWDINYIEKFVDSITEHVNKLENIPAVVLVSPKSYGQVEIETVEKENFVLIKNRLYEDIQEDIVIVKNKSFKREFDYENLKSMLLVTR